MADDLALALHMDPLEFRKKNCMRPGYVDPHTHVKCNTYGLAECMEKGREFIRWDEKRREYETRQDPCERESVWLSSAIRQAYIPYPWKQRPAA